MPPNRLPGMTQFAFLLIALYLACPTIQAEDATNMFIVVQTPESDQTKATSAKTKADSPKKAKQKSLFNGKDLTGWHVDVPRRDKNPDITPTFIVRQGKLVSLGNPQGHRITDSKYNH